MKIFQPNLLLLPILILFQLMINGVFAQTSPCITQMCYNGGTCIRDNVTQMETCNCTAFYQGFLCEQKIPSFIWTMDELCRLYFGPDYYSFSPLSQGSCSNLICSSFSNPNEIQTIMNAQGLICAPNSVCIDNACVPLSIQYTPVLDLVDRMIGNMSCQDYLNNGSLSFAQKFCNDPMAKSRCPVACSKYLSIFCNDQFNECSFFGNFCNSSTVLPAGGTPSLIRDICPYTCNQCPTAVIRCTSGLCLNGATCQNVTTVTGNSKVGYRCVCPPQYRGEYCEMRNPCFGVTCPTGRRCTIVGTYNYVCA